MLYSVFILTIKKIAAMHTILKIVAFFLSISLTGCAGSASITAEEEYQSILDLQSMPHDNTAGDEVRESFQFGLRLAGSEPQQAIKSFDHVIDMENDMPEAFLNRGILLEYVQDYGRAKEDLNTFLVLRPESELRPRVEETIRRLDYRQGQYRTMKYLFVPFISTSTGVLISLLEEDIGPGTGALGGAAMGLVFTLFL
jgi:tetratricopeptide (TPR) repeat protein